ncbi:hypothetical protein ANCCEY_08488 [Ancylostoma ceylanicum]|uniref:GHMP kinase C-terminal domain-containing protein n=1 Tax=Ancylostoma ceylanicum TaxID=53326 RepID=A0A0D6LXS1_9BILA|nr:hypothetical protein ANCCEY_08488 [Ancylostoma ceylanicum]
MVSVNSSDKFFWFRRRGQLQTRYTDRALEKFPDVVEGIFTSIDAISREAAKILHRPPEENGETLDKLENGGHGTTVPDNDHHSLQPHRGGSVRSSTFSSYVAGGKRGSSASAVSATSDKGELVDTFSKLNDLCRINNQLLIGLGVGHPKVDQICTTLARYGIHPKMTGAGGGGSVFAFLKPVIVDEQKYYIKPEIRKIEAERSPLCGIFQKEQTALMTW